MQRSFMRVLAIGFVRSALRMETARLLLLELTAVVRISTGGLVVAHPTNVIGWSIIATIVEESSGILVGAHSSNVDIPVQATSVEWSKVTIIVRESTGAIVALRSLSVVTPDATTMTVEWSRATGRFLLVARSSSVVVRVQAPTAKRSKTTSITRQAMGVLTTAHPSIVVVPCPVRELPRFAIAGILAAARPSAGGVVAGHSPRIEIPRIPKESALLLGPTGAVNVSGQGSRQDDSSGRAATTRTSTMRLLLRRSAVVVAALCCFGAKGQDPLGGEAFYPVQPPRRPPPSARP
ncbi:MAG: hypothetical protein AAFV29_22015, partial [Myxococcota bacterium]